MKQNDIIKESLVLKDILKKRIKELNLTYNQIAKESKKYNIGLTKEKLSVYFAKNDINNFPTQRQLIWLCFRYGIIVKLCIISEKFDDKICQKRTKKFFKM